MRYGVFSDVHGNLEALEVVLRALEEEKVDRTLCLGDLVGYGPNPNRCIERVMAFSDKIVAGNHDCAAVGVLSTTYFNEYARRAIDWTRDVLSSTSVDVLSGLPLLLVEEEVTMVHATPEAPALWDYIFYHSDARRSFAVLTTPLCFVGHSHVPVVFVRDEGGGVSLQDAGEVAVEEGKAYIINVGSVGQPRDGDPRASYGILDTQERRFWLRRLAYPVEEVQAKMRKEGLPGYLIDRLSVGE